MVTTSWFITAAEARNNVVKDIAVHSEITGIEHEILFATQRGDYEVTVSDNTLMTESSPDLVLPFTVDPFTDTLTVSAHNFKTGDVVRVSSTGELPPPLISTSYYYAIYIDSNHIKLATTRSNATQGKPVSIDFGQGVSTIGISNAGSGYLSAPIVSLVGGDPETVGTARAILQRFGPAATVSLTTAGAGYTDVPVASLSPVGNGASLGPCTFKTVSVSVLFGGAGYNPNELIYILGGAGVSAVFRVLTTDAGAVTSVGIVDPGDYSTLPTLSGALTSTTGGGAGCALSLTMGIKSIGISSPGSLYVNPPLVSLSGGGGSNATATATVVGGQITIINVTNSGSGFVSQPLVSVTTGSGATASVRLIPTSVDSVIITNSGGNTYTIPPSVQISTLGGGAAVLGVVMRAVSVSLINAGAGYVQGDQLLISGGVGTASTQIQVLTVDSQGRILTYNLVNPGAYTVLPSLSSNNSIGGSGIGASWNVNIGVNSVLLLSGGSGYTTAPLLVFTSSGGGGAAGYARVSGGVVVELVVTDSGSGYTSIPVASISGGSGATAVAHLLPTTVASVTLVDPGSGYVMPPTVILQGGGGIGATAQATLIGDSIDVITVVLPGGGYISAPEVIIEGNAQATAILSPTSVESISITHSGSGYTHVPTVSVSGAATAVAVLLPTGILSVDITSGGSNYVTDPVLTLLPGNAQIGVPVPPLTRVNRSFSVDTIQVLDSGSKYVSTPNVGVSAPEIPGVTCAATAVLGSGTGNFSIVPYEASQDYFKVWKNQTPSSELLIRPYTDQMSSVTKYFSDLGYTINRFTNPSTGSTIAWNVKW
jgi:hypothetical protein